MNIWQGLFFSDQDYNGRPVFEVFDYDPTQANEILSLLESQQIDPKKAYGNYLTIMCLENPDQVDAAELEQFTKFASPAVFQNHISGDRTFFNATAANPAIPKWFSIAFPDVMIWFMKQREPVKTMKQQEELLARLLEADGGELFANSQGKLFAVHLAALVGSYTAATGLKPEARFDSKT